MWDNYAAKAKISFLVALGKNTKSYFGLALPCQEIAPIQDNRL